jgi:hypothetical protein
MASRLVVVGNGMAAGRAMEELFARAPGRYDVTVFGAEPRVNYNRIMLSPVLSGEAAYEDILIHDEAWYRRHGVTLHRGRQIVAIDREAKTVTARDGMVVPYDRLLIATGSSTFIVPIPGSTLPGVRAYRDLDDVLAMREAARRGGKASPPTLARRHLDRRRAGGSVGFESGTGTGEDVMTEVSDIAPIDTELERAVARYCAEWRNPALAAFSIHRHTFTSWHARGRYGRVLCGLCGRWHPALCRQGLTEGDDR